MVTLPNHLCKYLSLKPNICPAVNLYQRSFLCSGQLLAQRHNRLECLSTKTPALNRTSIQAPTLTVQKTPWKRKQWGAGGQWGVFWNVIFWTGMASARINLHQLLPAQRHARHNSNRDTWKAISSLWLLGERESFFFRDVTASQLPMFQ